MTTKKTPRTTNAKDDAVSCSLTKYNLQRWQNIIWRLSKKPSNSAVLSCNKKFECNQCKNKFVRLSGLERHKAKSHAEDVAVVHPEKVNFFAGVIKCACCGAVFPDVKLYDRHGMCRRWEPLAAAFSPAMRGVANFSSQKWHVVIGTAYMCQFCDQPFSDLPSLLHHESLHDPADGFSCTFCELNFLSIEGILAHRISKPEFFMREHSGKIENVAAMYCCNVCSSGFQSLQELYTHRYEQQHYFPRISQKQLQMRNVIEHCGFCSYLSASAAQLTIHFNEKHAKASAVSTATVETVDSGDSHKHPASNQEESKTLTRPYLCEKCGKTYTQSSHLWQHLRFHNGVRPFVCPRSPCDRSFTIRPDLNDHIRKCHTGERPYKCEICDKRFLTGSVYYQHRLIHRGERRYACAFCDSRFYRADALKNHERIHTGEKPYHCDMCDKKFRQRGDREKHVRVKHLKIR